MDHYETNGEPASSLCCFLIFNRRFDCSLALQVLRLFSLSVYLYVTNMAYYSSFNGVRQWFAAAILFYGYRHFFDNRRRYMVTVFLASLFHTSAIVMIPIYYVVRKPFFRKANFLIAMIFVGFTLFLDSLT